MIQVRSTLRVIVYSTYEKELNYRLVNQYPIRNHRRNVVL